MSDLKSFLPNVIKMVDNVPWKSIMGELDELKDTIKDTNVKDILKRISGRVWKSEDNWDSSAKSFLKDELKNLMRTYGDVKVFESSHPVDSMIESVIEGTNASAVVSESPDDFDKFYKSVINKLKDKGYKDTPLNDPKLKKEIEKDFKDKFTVDKSVDSILNDWED